MTGGDAGAELKLDDDDELEVGSGGLGSGEGGTRKAGAVLIFAVWLALVDNWC